MTLKNGSPEELRRVLNHIREKHDIPFWLLEREMINMKRKVSLTTIYKFLIYGLRVPKKEKYLWELVEKLKQKYPDEALQPESNSREKLPSLPIVKQTPSE